MSSAVSSHATSSPIAIKNSVSHSHSHTYTLPLTPPPEDEIAHRVQARKPDMTDKNMAAKNENENGGVVAVDNTDDSAKVSPSKASRPNLKVNTQKASSKGSRLPRPPSLKQITAHLNNNTTTTTTTTASNATSTGPAQQTIVEEALSDVTANTANATNTANAAVDVPQQNSDSIACSSSPPATTAATTGTRRLKLPPSAMTRVNLSSSFVKSSSSSSNKEVKENKDQLKSTIKETKENKDSADLAPSFPPPMETSPTPHSTPNKLRGRQSVGLGLPGLGLALDTPPRPKSTSVEDKVPDLVIQKSTPDRSAVPEKRVTNENGEHPLAHEWTLFYDSKTYKPETPVKKEDHHLSSWEASLLTVGTVNTVEGFARHMNNIRLPSSLSKGSNYHLFKDGIRPMWEDPANKNGGKWVMFVRGLELLDSAWAYLAMALVGEMLDSEDKVCGIVVSTRPKIDRIQIWTRTADDIEYLNGLAQRILDTLGLEGRDKDNISLEFQPNQSNVKAAPELMSITLPNMVNRSASLATISGPGGHQLRRSPSSPGASFGGSPTPGHSLLAPLNGSPVPMRRTGSAGANAFSGPLGAPRRLVSTTADSSA